MGKGHVKEPTTFRNHFICGHARGRPCIIFVVLGPAFHVIVHTSSCMCVHDTLADSQHSSIEHLDVGSLLARFLAKEIYTNPVIMHLAYSTLPARPVGIAESPSNWQLCEAKWFPFQHGESGSLGVWEGTPFCGSMGSSNSFDIRGIPFCSLHQGNPTFYAARACLTVPNAF